MLRSGNPPHGRNHERNPPWNELAAGLYVARADGCLEGSQPA